MVSGEQEENNSVGRRTAPTYTVGDLCELVATTIEQAFGEEVWVQGAISGLTRSNNGHAYFDLIDPTEDLGSTNEALLPVALFATARRNVNRALRGAGGMRMNDGMEIRIRGKVTYYPPQGRVQLVMSSIDPNFTLGQMAVAREALLEKLRQSGLIESNKLVDFPPLPLRVALVTSARSAAAADFCEQLTQSGYPFEISLLDSRVQGLDAVGELVGALQYAATMDVDVIAVCRGGGARTDLAVFDNEEVVTAIAKSPRPVIVGIGHETDTSVADGVANRSTKTPTAAAVELIEAVAEFDYRSADAAERLTRLATLHTENARLGLVGRGVRLMGAAAVLVDQQQTTLAHASVELARGPTRILERADNALTLASTRLSALDPQTVLRRGWSITRTETGELIRSASQVTADTVLSTRTSDGLVTSIVTKTAPGESTELNDTEAKK